MVLGPRRAEDVGEGVRDAGAELSRRVGGRGRVKKCHDLGLMTMTKEFNGDEFDDGADDDDDGDDNAQRLQPLADHYLSPVQDQYTYRLQGALGLSM